MNGVVNVKYCCEDMEEQVAFKCSEHKDKYSCPDCLIEYNEVYDEYGLLVHDGGSASISISFCPWCGKKLPDSKRDLWFEALEELGFDEPSEQDVPEKFKTSKWYEE